MRIYLLAFLSLLLISTKAQINTSLLDTSYNHGGYRVYNDYLYYQNLAAEDVSATGEVIGITAGQLPWYYLFNLTPNGQLDTTFGINGYVQIPFSAFSQFYNNQYSNIYPNDIAILPNNKLVVLWTLHSDTFAKRTKIVVTCFNSNGSVDSSFANNGHFTTEYANYQYSYGLKLLTQADNKIIILGLVADAATQPPQFQDVKGNIVIRLTSNGYLDTAFNAVGYRVLRNTRTEWIVLTQQGNYLLPYIKPVQQSIYSFSVAGVNFVGDSIPIADAYYFDYNDTPGLLYTGIDIDNNNKLTITGSRAEDLPETSYLITVRLNADMTLDQSFGSNGRVFYTDSNFIKVGHTVNCDAAGNAYTCSVSYKIHYDSLGHYFNEGYMLILKYNNQGVLDTSFGYKGKYYLNIPETPVADNIDPLLYFINQNTQFIARTGIEIGTTTLHNSYMFAKINIDTVSLILGIVDNPTITQPILAYPNPIQNSTINLSYVLTNKQDVSVDLYNLQGQLIASLVTKQPRQKGNNTEVLSLPKGLASGQYIVRVVAGEYQKGIKVLVH